jgi:hypothetical protein
MDLLEMLHINVIMDPDVILVQNVIHANIKRTMVLSVWRRNVPHVTLRKNRNK